MKRKAALLSSLRAALARQRLPEVVLALDGNVSRTHRRAAAQAAADRAQREARNRMTVLTFLGPVAVGLCLALAGLVWYNHRQRRPLGLAHWFGLGLVAFVYVFEVLFFLLVVETYIMVGDYELLRGVTGLTEEEDR